MLGSAMATTTVKGTGVALCGFANGHGSALILGLPLCSRQPHLPVRLNLASPPALRDQLGMALGWGREWGRERVQNPVRCAPSRNGSSCFSRTEHLTSKSLPNLTSEAGWKGQPRESRRRPQNWSIGKLGRMNRLAHAFSLKLIEEDRGSSPCFIIAFFFSGAAAVGVGRGT